MMGSRNAGTLTLQGIDAAVETAMRKILSDVPPERRRETVGRLRRELQRCLTEAPGAGGAVQELKLRSQLAASFSRHLGPLDEDD
ncbi:hypothetical protein VQH23_23680 [Pararoseomonas sp. SCSIO 73927]|uniref:hypothetical protein n=1 Tax=Pararoseomonas sp. SCSIO 73927 TaxID=3114537 RepID=UPI0030CA9790